ncbi:MAG: glycosyltransferase family 4 protein [Bacteroidales bacterium]|nr:glycosyltransferase family 4 protein [Bacteroidales bacterium]MBQ7820632.1 glycosyltransferase family 4 protein [Bacteroidales bacterium]
MRNILILANSIVGLFSFRKEVVHAYIKEGYKVYISIPKGEEVKEQYFIDNGCILIYQNIDRRGTNPIQDLKLLCCYIKLIKRIKPIAVLTYTIKPNIYGGIAARIKNVPQLANITGLGSSINGTGLLSKFSLFLYKLGLSKAHTVFYQNQMIKIFCEKNNIGNKGILLPGSGVNLDWHVFQPYPEKESTITFLFIGRIMKDKGIDEFISMVKYIRSKYKNVDFRLLGECEENYQQILNHLQNDGLLIWHSHVSDVRPYLKASHCTILPSYHEGMANVLLESCATGRPIIASNINGCKEAIDDGVNGFLCEVKNTESLKDKVEAFINLSYEEKKQMGIAARKKVEREFDRNIVVNAYLEETEKVIK